MTSTNFELAAVCISSASWVNAKTPHAKIYAGPAPTFTEAQLAEVREACARIQRFEAQLLRECRNAPLMLIDPLIGQHGGKKDAAPGQHA